MARNRSGLDALMPERLAPARQSLQQAQTLPAEAFTSPEIYAREVERLFSREWLCAGRADQIPAPGDYFCLDLLGEKLVVVRDRNGGVRALSRICRHRGAELVSGSGNTRAFLCPYHAWSYQLDGRLAGGPLLDRMGDFDREACRLPELRSELWEGWIFVNLDSQAQPLAPQLAPLSELLAPYDMAEMVAVETASFPSPFNWKVLVDNFMEAYHHVATHRDTLEPIFPGALSYVPDAHGPYSALVMPLRPAEDAEAPTAASPNAGISKGEAMPLVAAVVYPSHLFAPSAESLAWYQILPEGPDHFTLRVYTCFPREVLDDESHAERVRGMQELTKTIHIQDIAACEAVQAGMQTPSFESGRLSSLERAIWQFNQWWTERMMLD